MKWLDGLRVRLRLLFGRRSAAARVEEEFRFHLEMEAERLVREARLTPEEARRRALVAFGGVERYKEELRDGRGLAWLTGLSLDLKLGFRMLRKYPVLTAASVLALGLAAARWGIRWGMDLFWEVQQMRPPFWWDAGLSTTSVLYAFALAVLGAVIIGGIPGLRATGRNLRQRITQPGSGGSAMRFGAIATGVIIVQVALCVAFIPVAIMNGQDLLPDRNATDFPADAYLTGRLIRQAEPPGPAGSGAAAAERDGERRRAGELFDEVHRRVATEPGVVAAARADRIPGFNHRIESIELEGDSSRIVDVRLLAVDPNYFEVVGARIASGRAFRPEDVTAAVDVAVVDRSWAEWAFGGRNPIGRRIRYPTGGDEEHGRWYEIVGVVTGMERAIGPGTAVRVFRPLRPDDHRSVQLFLRTAGPPTTLVPQVHGIVTALDPGLGIVDLKPLDEVWRPVRRSDTFFATALGVVSLLILLFALIGIYALTSFTVAQRAREIGIRTALGANPRRIITAIFSRALLQIGLGIVAGGVLVSMTVARSPEGLRTVAGVAAAMVVVGLAGCAVPAVRALRIQPVEALRAE